MDWQPIETAPRDGTAFLAWDPTRAGYVADQRYFIAYWAGSKWGNVQNGGWPMDWEITHWHPLPAPPQVKPKTIPDSPK